MAALHKQGEDRSENLESSSTNSRGYIAPLGTILHPLSVTESSEVGPVAVLNVVLKKNFQQTITKCKFEGGMGKI